MSAGVGCCRHAGANNAYEHLYETVIGSAQKLDGAGTEG